MKLTAAQRKRVLKEFGHIPTKEELLTEALQGAWETVLDDPEIRAQLSQVVGKTAQFQENLFAFTFG